MPKSAVTIEVVEEEDKRFLLKVYADGTEERIPIAKEAPKKGHMSSKIAWYRDLRTGRKVFY